jgi:cobalamin biosynthesis Mg chelatase CobN
VLEVRAKRMQILKFLAVVTQLKTMDEILITQKAAEENNLTDEDKYKTLQKLQSIIETRESEPGLSSSVFQEVLQQVRKAKTKKEEDGSSDQNDEDQDIKSSVNNQPTDPHESAVSEEEKSPNGTEEKIDEKVNKNQTKTGDDLKPNDDAKKNNPGAVSNDNKNTSKGKIIGVSIGVAVFVLGGAVGFLYWNRKRRGDIEKRQLLT